VLEGGVGLVDEVHDRGDRVRRVLGTLQQRHTHTHTHTYIHTHLPETRESVGGCEIR